MSYSLLTETEAWVQIYVFFKQKGKKIDTIDLMQHMNTKISLR